jgi:hypothetical protein
MAACLYPLRRWLGFLRWSGLGMLVFLHMIMQKPVWHLISRIDIAGGSTGWHRYNLIDQAINRFSEWALIGTKSTAHWAFGMDDVTNQFVLEGVKGGAGTLVLFVLLIVLAFRRVGWMLRDVDGSRFAMIASWSLGVSLFIHCLNFIAVSYFGQITLLWFLHLAMIGSLAPDRAPQRLRATSAARAEHPVSTRAQLSGAAGGWSRVQ